MGSPCIHYIWSMVSGTKQQIAQVLSYRLSILLDFISLWYELFCEQTQEPVLFGKGECRADGK